jgi:asparagine synthase (glutamine-hydrolysing)
MLSASGRHVVVFNGEIYNFQALRKELSRDDSVWRGHSDTEVMLAAFERWGVPGALRRFNGMFAFALWDRHERTLYLARDRLGEKPLYYGWLGHTFVFSSELKALRAHPAWRGEIDRDAVAVYLRHGFVPAPYSIYKGIGKLPAAHSLCVPLSSDAPTADPQPYWSLKEAAESGVANPLTHDENASAAELDELLRDAVQIRTLADVPVGVFLSGGVDSSTVVALMQAQSSCPVKSFSIGFEQRSYNEAPHAKEIARVLGTDHTELYVSAAEAMDVVPRLPHIYDEPFADPSQIPTILVSQLARQAVTVALSGDGGDELFCGYVRYFWGRRLWNKISPVPNALRTIASRALTAIPHSSWDTLIGGLLRYVPSTALGEVTGDRVHKFAEVLSAPSTDVFYRRLTSQWNDPSSVVIGSRELSTTLMDRTSWAALDDFTQRMMYLDAMMYLPDDILVKVDRATMSTSLEARVPLLDHRVVEYAWRVPLNMKIRNGQSKWLLRQVLYKYVPAELIERPKTGFGVPIDSWLRGPLRDWADTLLQPSTLQSHGIFEIEPIRQKWREHLSGARNWQNQLWNVLMFQSWLEAQH